MGGLTDLFYRSAEKLCSLLHIIKVFETNKGLKNINMRSVSDIGKVNASEYLELDCNELFLGPDFLKDDYTLLGCSISQSPHRFFMDALLNDSDLYETEYVKRTINGTIDWRRPQKIKDLSYWKSRFTKVYPTVVDDTYSPAVVYYRNGNYYIYDGKHRAALCAALGRKVKCSLIPDNCVTGFYGRYFFEIMKDKKNYDKHKAFVLERKDSE
jgi:hypothetical protein